MINQEHPAVNPSSPGCMIGNAGLKQYVWLTLPNVHTQSAFRHTGDHLCIHIIRNIVSLSQWLCYISITMSTWSPSLIITTIITPIRDAYSCLPHYQSPLFTRTFPRATPEPLPRSYYSTVILLWVHITLSSLPLALAYLMSTLFNNHRQISPWTLYSTIGPSACVSGYRHAQNDLLYLSHVYSMSQILLVVYSSYIPLY